VTRTGGIDGNLMSSSLLDFEKPIAELEGKVKELQHLATGSELDLQEEIDRLESRASKLLAQTYSKLTPWQKAQVARHPDRPRFKDYVEVLVKDFMPLAGDRAFADDDAIQGGLGRFRGRSIMLVGHEKGADTAERVRHNFGMARPEGYRKAVRLMKLAERFNLPVVTVVDTPGAHPGIDAEERGQAEAIARSIECCLGLKVPIVSVIVGEGGSGGAIALAAADRVLMLEHSIYSVISPEGCAAILWRSSEKAPDAAEALRFTGEDLLGFKLVDEVIPEPLGGAHRGRATTIEHVGSAIERHLCELSGLDGGDLRKTRRDKFLAMGSAHEG
jgi:acetyl-CoA carboxylase carboxyl transferase subunit alpha